MMEEEFRGLLKATAALTAIVGQRIDYGERPQGQQMPDVLLNVVSGFEGIHMNGTGPFEGRIQVDCYGLTYSDAKRAARAVVDALNFYRGGGFMIITHLSTRDTREGGSNDADRSYRTGMDFNIIWRPQ